MAASATPTNHGPQTNGHVIPFSARKSAALDLSTVERRGEPSAVPNIRKTSRPFGLEEAPTYYPTEKEWEDPLAYVMSVAPEASKYGIMKVIPPDTWLPDLAIDTEKFHFKTRRQALNSVEGGTRANGNYLDQLQKFHRNHGTNLNRFPSVDKRPLDLYKLKKAVECRGGFEKVCKGKKWAEIGRDLGYSGKIMSSLSTSLKNSYSKWLLPYEEWLKHSKPGVQRQMEFENGGPYTPSPSPMKKMSQHATPTPGFQDDSPAMKASSALQTSLQNAHVPTSAPEPRLSSGFTAVNAGGFTAVNAHVAPVNATSSFSAINSPANGPIRDSEQSTPMRCIESPRTSANTPDMRPSVFGTSTPLSNGHGNSKRPFSSMEDDTLDPDSADRRSKRIKKEAAPTITGSHMTQPRTQTPRFFNPRDRSKHRPGDNCEICDINEVAGDMVLCDDCEGGYHIKCLDPPLSAVPTTESWFCAKCLVGTGEFGFEDGGIYSLKQFQEKARNFKDNHFASKQHFDPILNQRRQVSEDEVEREFWRLVDDVQEQIEVEYGADIGSATHGSGFPTVEKHPRDKYARDPWNLNRLPFVPDSLFRYIKSNISGMTQPWLYVGMVFSTFCWHAEDHYTYSANYQHFGATKTWYGIPADDAEKFEEAMKAAVPELFESQPDLLFQLVTLLTPDHLRKAGVRVYALDQRAGQLVITFPQAYHSGFNHGFNMNEAVNFAPSDWEPYGEAGALRLQDFRRDACFSHDELLMNAASQKDITIKTAKWLAPALQRLLDRELKIRHDFTTKHHEKWNQRVVHLNGTGVTSSVESEPCRVPVELREDEVFDGESPSCAYCHTYTYLSRMHCLRSESLNKDKKDPDYKPTYVCLIHAGAYECCDMKEEERFLGIQHAIIHRSTNESLQSVVDKVTEKAHLPEAWAEKLDKFVEDEPKPSLKGLKSLLAEGEKIQWDLEPRLSDLRRSVDRYNEWVEEAMGYITRRQQNRRKNDRVWRKGNSSKAAEEERERERDYRNIKNITRLLEQAEELSFECPEITTLKERAESIAEFQVKAKIALTQQMSHSGAHSLDELEELVELGRGFNVDIPEVEMLDNLVQQFKWDKEAREKHEMPLTMQQVVDFLVAGRELGIPETNEHYSFYEEQKRQGEMWNAKALELIEVETVHYQQLDALAKQARNIPVIPETFNKIDAILKKQREAQEQIITLYEKTRSSDVADRPTYKEVCEVMSALSELNSKPPGTLDLEKEQKRHEDWMRRGKKLFGKANAPLHILHSHMKLVEEKNRACFDIEDQPRGPVEPASREQTPVDDRDEERDIRDVFCICRKSEAGMMIECELCHEWYHGKCLKIARGKVKEDDKYTCPICDHRVKIPRDAARPKLEDLQQWQDDIENLPFQPDEEETLEAIIQHGQNFRNYVQRYTNPTAFTWDEGTILRFYLRKLEGADILLASETNYFRQELHKFCPVADRPPPMIEVSLSTRKPRPTKQQKLMAEYGVNSLEELPAHVRPKGSQLKRKHSDSSGFRQHMEPAEPSTTPPGMPPSMEANTTSYFENSHNPAASSFHNSPIFTSASTFNVTSPGPFSASRTLQGESATMFDSPNVPFGSSGSGGLENIFNDDTHTQIADSTTLQFGSEMDTVERTNDVDEFLATGGD
ncbi:PLU-1-domain-containing protein [Pseudovirgaria hyperparasitica]|uniref:PLU-1-domain-containing protein n=1 Tax=Pseudovirgaria hyperparasitica TaxID=470096 RepID=A0A6A6VYQ7_9PEZI|nr:PLU-1-domain-containing protein [Pseudovirgaria hyperparasitica]KAF2754810.1 PLU-1-domain-containing protein [Pseudovirgaria hyperparasitica]